MRCSEEPYKIDVFYSPTKGDEDFDVRDFLLMLEAGGLDYSLREGEKNLRKARVVIQDSGVIQTYYNEDKNDLVNHLRGLNSRLSFRQ